MGISEKSMDLVIIEQPEHFLFPDRHGDLESLSRLTDDVLIIANVDEKYKIDILLQRLSEGCKCSIGFIEDLFFSNKNVLLSILSNLGQDANIMFGGAHLSINSSGYTCCVAKAIGLVDAHLRGLRKRANYFVSGKYIIGDISNDGFYSVSNIKPMAFPQFSVSLSQIL